MPDTTTENQAPGEVGQKQEQELKTIGIIGSRRRRSKADYDQLRAALGEIYNEGDIIVSGGCPQGGDFFAEGLARRLGATIVIHHANWDKYGKRAGFERNDKIALDADVLIALVADDRRGGTEDTIRKYHDLGKGNLIILETGKPPCVGITDHEPAPCAHDPTETTGPIGMYHCPECAEMVVAGHAHPALEPETPAPQTTVVHISQPYDVYIGRRGHGQDGYYGNPHPVGKPCPHCAGTTHDRDGAIAAFEADFLDRVETDHEYRQRILDLAGKRLGCFCAPRACHGDIIAAWLNRRG